MTFGARDADKQPIDDAVFTIEARPQIPTEKSTQQCPVPLVGTDNLARFLETRGPWGLLASDIEAKKDGQAIGTGTDVRFIVYDQDLELHNPAADFALLEEIARITGGTVVSPGELARPI